VSRRHLAEWVPAGSGGVASEGWSGGGPVRAGGRALLQRCLGNPEAFCPANFQYCSAQVGLMPIYKQYGL
jgi:hypothetical protein